MLEVKRAFGLLLSYNKTLSLKLSNKMPTQRILCLFDVDGTLTEPRKIITPDMLQFITEEIQPKCAIGLVGGSDEVKIAEQMGGLAVIDKFDYVFSENGLVAKKKGIEIGRTTILSHMGEEKLQTFINFALKCLSEIKLPAKRGNFIEFRTGLINICPVGRSCSQKERDEFGEFDKVHKIRETLVQKFNSNFPDFGLNYALGECQEVTEENSDSLKDFLSYQV